MKLPALLTLAGSKQSLPEAGPDAVVVDFSKHSSEPMGRNEAGSSLEPAGPGGSDPEDQRALMELDEAGAGDESPEPPVTHSSPRPDRACTRLDPDASFSNCSLSRSRSRESCYSVRRASSVDDIEAMRAEGDKRGHVRHASTGTSAHWGRADAGTSMHWGARGCQSPSTSSWGWQGARSRSGCGQSPPGTQCWAWEPGWTWAGPGHSRRAAGVAPVTCPMCDRLLTCMCAHEHTAAAAAGMAREHTYMSNICMCTWAWVLLLLLLPEPLHVC